MSRPNFYRSRGKRLVDVLGASVALAFTAPLQLAGALGVLSTMGRPVLFRQLRPGLNGDIFTLLKMRTMRPLSADEDVINSDESRLSGFGAFLRSTSVDELPELFNVLRGDMSLVGPRPLLVEYLDLYSPEQARRHEVRPGITGWAQVNGRNALTWEEKFDLDVWYIDNITPLLDLKILWLTLSAVIRREGVSGEGSATARAFTGSPVAEESVS